MDKYAKKILNSLLDKYEKSKRFSDSHKIDRKIALDVDKLFKGYNYDSNLDLFSDVNSAIEYLIEKRLIESNSLNNVYTKVWLSISAIDESYKLLSRAVKKDTNATLSELLIEYKDKNQFLKMFCEVQITRINQNKNVDGFVGDISDYRDILKCLGSIFDIQSEIFYRDFSVKVFGDSKRFEKIISRLRVILWKYGNFTEKETVFEELNIVKTPSFVYFKGDGDLTIKDHEKVNVAIFKSGIGVSSVDLQDITSIFTKAERIVTIENLTNFYTFHEKNCFAIYLGGYHNAARRKLIKLIHNDNQNKEFLHYGDIDAGGFYILKHLIERTEIDFKPHKMDVEMLLKCRKYWRSLSENDIVRLKKLQESDYSETIMFMLKNNCKLEQEALNNL